MRAVVFVSKAEASAWLQGYDIMEEMYNQKTAAINFIQELCKSRVKASLQTVMSIAVQVMNEYQKEQVCLVVPFCCQQVHPIPLAALPSPLAHALPSVVPCVHMTSPAMCSALLLYMQLQGTHFCGY